MVPVLAGVGLYGVLSFGVAQRTREFGVRLAVGASPRDVRRLVVGEGLLLTAIGLAAGIVGGAKAVLRGGSPRDAAPYLLAVGIVASVSSVAFWLPPWRASRVDPAAALRADET